MEEGRHFLVLLEWNLCTIAHGGGGGDGDGYVVAGSRIVLQGEVWA